LGLASHEPRSDSRYLSFISDIVNASKTNETLCENNMIILKLLSEEVFDFSRDEMTSAKAKKLKESFNADFSLIVRTPFH
jgi:exportin-1